MLTFIWICSILLLVIGTIILVKKNKKNKLDTRIKNINKIASNSKYITLENTLSYYKGLRKNIYDRRRKRILSKMY